MAKRDRYVEAKVSEGPMQGKGRHELTNISVCPAENGYTVRCSYGDYMEQESYVFNSAEEAAEHIEAMLKKHSEKEE